MKEEELTFVEFVKKRTLEDMIVIGASKAGLEYVEQYANERAIKELKKLDGIDNIRYEVERRIKELER